MTTTAQQHESQLARCNQELADILGQSPLELSTGGAATMRDRLWVWGVLGGKEVGKSTLINALAGDNVVEYGDPMGEGTFRPAAYCSPDDESALRGRFGELKDIDVTFHPNAPTAMRGLVLVDLPDFDSVFADHVQQVRRMSNVLDGIIWITTPKKVGDERAIREIHRVLKDRANFVYVLNKMDWLVAQEGGDPAASLKRAATQLDQQAQAGSPSDTDLRKFLIAARYPQSDRLRDAIISARSGGQEQVAADNGSIDAAVNALTADFESLRTALTTPPPESVSAANKKANLSYQLATQSKRLLDYYKPQPILDRLNKAADIDETRERVREYLTDPYCTQLVRRLNDEDALLVDWSAKLFKRRITYWPLLGLVAWPLVLIGAMFNRLRNLWTGSTTAGAIDDPFRADGIALRERMEGAVASQQAALGGLAIRLSIELPTPEQLEQTFRLDATRIAVSQRQATLDRMLHKSPGALGRFVRGVIAILALLWFPIIQPILAIALPPIIAAWSSAAQQSVTINWSEFATGIVGALSASRMLAGLLVSVILMLALVAAVYSRSVRDAQRAIERLTASPADMATHPLLEPTTAALNQPVSTVHDRLRQVIDTVSDSSGPQL